MSGKILRRPRSERDVVGIAYHIAQRSLSAADRFLDAYDQTLKDLLALPYLGSPWETPQPKHADLRCWPVNGFPNHLIFYCVSSEGIEVVRVLHGSRDLDTMLGE